MEPPVRFKKNAKKYGFNENDAIIFKIGQLTPIKKILFACDTGIGDIYKDIGNKYGPIDLTFINIGAYNFYPIMPYKDKSVYHTNPEEALEIAKNLKSKKVIGMHWGTFVLSLEPIMEPPVRFKANAEKYGFKKEDAIIYKIGEFGSLKKLLNYN